MPNNSSQNTKDQQTDQQARTPDPQQSGPDATTQPRGYLVTTNLESDETLVLPPERFLQHKPIDAHLRQGLHNSSRFGGRFVKLSLEQEHLLTAVTVLAQEREAVIVAGLSRDFFSLIRGAVQWSRDAIRRPLISPSQVRTTKSHSATDTDTASPATPAPDSFIEKLLVYINVQNLAIATAALLLTWTGYQKVRTETLESTIETLQTSIKAVESTKDRDKQRIAEANTKADSLRDELTASANVVQELKSDNARLSERTSSQESEIASLQERIASIQSKAEESADEAAATASKELASQASQLAQLRLEMGETKTKLAAANASNQSLSERLKREESDRKAAYKQVRVMQQQVRELESEQIQLNNIKSLHTIAQSSLLALKKEIGRWGGPRKDELQREIETYQRRTKEASLQ